MNKREFLKKLALAGVAVGTITPSVAEEILTSEVYFANIRKDAPIGAFFQIIKISETEWVIYGKGIKPTSIT